MWNPDDIILELARIERRAFEAVRARNVAQQKGEAFRDLPQTVKGEYSELLVRNAA